MSAAAIAVMAKAKAKAGESARSALAWIRVSAYMCLGLAAIFAFWARHGFSLRLLDEDEPRENDK